MEETILKVIGMQKFYHELHILKGINFTMKKGEFVAVMGASGSGKTTFLNCISAMERFEEGTVKFNGTNICEFNEKQLAAFRRDELGFIFQEYNLLDTLTIRENIILPLTLGQKKEFSQKVEKLAQLFQIEHILDKLSAKVSGGERQRCACVRALIKEPSLILADEPTGALDQNASRTLMRSMCKMNEEFDTSVLMVTHDPFSASYSDRTVFIQDGKITKELCKDMQSQEKYLDEILQELYAEGRDFCMIWKVIRQNLKRSVYEYMIYFFTLIVGVTAFYSYAVLMDRHFRTDMELSTAFSVLSDKMLYAAPFIFLIPTMLIIYIERFLYARKQKELAILIMSGLRQSKAAYLYCIERMIVALLGIVSGIVSGGMISSLVLYRHLTYVGEKLVVKPLFYPFTILLTCGYFIFVFTMLSIHYGRKIMKSPIVDMFRITEDNKPYKNTAGRSGSFALAAGCVCFIYISGIIICIMLVCFGYFPIIYKLLCIVCIMIPVLLLGIFIKNRNIYHITVTVICMGVVEDGMLCALYPLLDSLTKVKFLNPQLCYLLVLGMVFMLFSVIFLFYEIFSELLLEKRYKYNKQFGENRVILGDICNDIHIYGKVMAAITLVMAFMIVIGIWSPIYLERIEGYLHERSVFDMQLFTTISYNKYANRESSTAIDFKSAAEYLEKDGIVTDDEIMIETFFVEERLEKEEGDRLATCVSLSDYNQLLLSLQKEPIVLTGEYAIQWDQEYTEEQMAEALGGVSSITAGEDVLWNLQNADAQNYTYETGMALFTNHMKYVYIVPDNLCKKLNRATSIALYRFDSGVDYETAVGIEGEMNSLFENSDCKVYVRLKTLQETETMAVITLVRIIVGYMETILILGCLAMLSVQQLTNILQSRRKYKILYFLGFTRYGIKRLAFKNEMAWFLMPVVSAAVIAMGGIVFSFVFFLEDFMFYSSKEQILMFIVESYVKIVGFSFLYIITTWLITRKYVNAGFSS